MQETLSRTTYYILNRVTCNQLQFQNNFPNSGNTKSTTLTTK